MNYKKSWCFFLFLLCVNNAYGVGGGGLLRLFRARNDAADVYAWTKESTRDSLRAFISFGCALGVFKFLRSTKNAGKLVAFMEAAGLGSTVYQLLGIMRKFTLNYLVRLSPWVASKRRRKVKETESLFRFLDTHTIKTDDQLPGDEHVRSKTEKKMMERLRAHIGYGGLDADTQWVEKLMVNEAPDYAGKIPAEIGRCIAYINDPKRYQKHGATLRKGLPLVGAPGGGKTTLARLIAYATDCPFIEDSPAALMNTYVGTGPNALKEIFDNAESAACAAHRKRYEVGFFRSIWEAIKRIVFRVRQEKKYVKPAILCLNELDSIAGQRGAQANDHAERRNTLLQLLNSIDEHPHVFVIGTSNEETAYFDKALIRPGRMGAPVAIPLPDEEDRFEIIKYYSKKAPTLSPDLRVTGFVKLGLIDKVQPIDHLVGHTSPDHYLFWHSIVQRTGGFSGDELRQLFNDAEILAGDGNNLYLDRPHLEHALESMLAEMPADRRERCRAHRPEAQVEHAGLQAQPIGLGVHPILSARRDAEDTDPEAATMDGEAIADI